MKLDTKAIEKILQQMKENTKTECIAIRTKICDRRLPVTSSKFGGFPYWPKGKLDLYPHTSENARIPLTMLAQINLSDLPENDVFPRAGMLQFFIFNGMDTDPIKVVFHKEIKDPVAFTRSGPIIPTSFMPEEIEITNESGEKEIVPNLFWGGEWFPVTGEFALEFYKKWDFVNPTEDCFETEFKKAAEQLGIHIPNSFSIYGDLSNDIYDEFYETAGGHKLLGRPAFVQWDCRAGEHENDILLFQMDSAWPASGTTDEYHFIEFGDAGTANFFISKDDLKKYDFSNVLYDWQCF